MEIKKVVYFDKPGERDKLNELAEKYKSESTLAIHVEKEFKIPFNDAMVIANIWLKVVNKKQQQCT